MIGAWDLRDRRRLSSVGDFMIADILLEKNAALTSRSTSDGNRSVTSGTRPQDCGAGLGWCQVDP